MAGLLAGMIFDRRGKGLAAGTHAAAEPKGRRQVDGTETPVYARGAIADTPAAGPMIIEEPYTTLWLPAGWTIRHVGAGNLLAERG